MTEGTTRDVAAAVRELLRRLAPGACEGRQIGDDTPLDGRGAGLDSVARVELLLECEQEFGVRLAQSLLDEGCLTIRRIAEHVQRAQAGGATAP
ncbi:MAG: acyl carrier protein [Vicinamibacterales bacterium]